MPKRKQTKIGPRDIELMAAIDRCPLTVTQLRRLSQTFESPFADEGNLRRRLRNLSQSGLLNSWRYAIASEGQSPRYFKLGRDGYRMLHGMDAVLPRRRYFEEISHGHHHHTYSLAESIVHLIRCGHRENIRIQQFARENSVKLEANGFTMFPDCAFQLQAGDGRRFNFVVELDNGSERVRSQRDVESIERKLRGYDAHQSQFAVTDPRRYLVLFIATRSSPRLKHILDLAFEVMQNPQRTVFLACDLPSFLKSDPFSSNTFCDHRGLRRVLLPRSPESTNGNVATRTGHSPELASLCPNHQR